MLAKGSLNNIFQDSFNKILSQQLTHDRSYIYHTLEILNSPYKEVVETRDCMVKGFTDMYRE